MQIGDIDVVNTLLNLQSKVFVMEQIIDHIFEKNPDIIKPNTRTLESINDNALKYLQEQYPNMGIKRGGK